MKVPEKYINGKYLDENPTWHAEDSSWKAEQIIKIVQRNNISPKSICEIGCGAGEILRQLHNKMSDDCYFSGYEISPQAYEICKEKETSHLKFEYKDFLLEVNAHFDIILLIDIIEHLEDYFTYLREIKKKSDYKILHVPLEFFALSSVYQSLIINQRKKSGHLHYFTKDIILQVLAELDYETIDYFYTPGYSLDHNYGIKDKLVRIPRKYFYPINQDLTVKIFGGYSLMILAK